MATYTSDQITNGFPVTQPDAGVVAHVRGRVSVTSAPANADVLQFFKLPKGAVPCRLKLYGDGISDGVDVELGHGTDQDAYGLRSALDFTAIGANTNGADFPGLIQDADAVPLTQEETISLVLTSAPGTPLAGDVYLDCLYTMAITNT